MRKHTLLSSVISLACAGLMGCQDGGGDVDVGTAGAESAPTAPTATAPEKIDFKKDDLSEGKMPKTGAFSKEMTEAGAKDTGPAKTPPSEAPK